MTWNNFKSSVYTPDMKIVLATTPKTLLMAAWSDYKHHTQLNYFFVFFFAIQQ